jgi:hypothetical protein
VVKESNQEHANTAPGSPHQRILQDAKRACLRFATRPLSSVSISRWRVFVVLGYIVSLLSSLFSLYKLRIFVRERVQRLKAASIKPTLKRIVFMERTLAKHSKLMILSLADNAGPAAMTWSLKWCAVFKGNCSSSSHNNKN